MNFKKTALLVVGLSMVPAAAFGSEERPLTLAEIQAASFDFKVSVPDPEKPLPAKPTVDLSYKVYDACKHYYVNSWSEVDGNLALSVSTKRDANGRNAIQCHQEMAAKANNQCDVVVDGTNITCTNIWGTPGMNTRVLMKDRATSGVGYVERGNGPEKFVDFSPALQYVDHETRVALIQEKNEEQWISEIENCRATASELKEAEAAYLKLERSSDSTGKLLNGKNVSHYRRLIDGAYMKLARDEKKALDKELAKASVDDLPSFISAYQALGEEYPEIQKAVTNTLDEIAIRLRDADQFDDAKEAVVAAKDLAEMDDSPLSSTDIARFDARYGGISGYADAASVKSNLMNHYNRLSQEPSATGMWEYQMYRSKLDASWNKKMAAACGKNQECRLQYQDNIRETQMASRILPQRAYKDYSTRRREEIREQQRIYQEQLRMEAEMNKLMSEYNSEAVGNGWASTGWNENGPSENAFRNNSSSNTSTLPTLSSDPILRSISTGGSNDFFTSGS